jgi:hypothetical protein
MAELLLGHWTAHVHSNEPTPIIRKSSQTLHRAIRAPPSRSPTASTKPAARAGAKIKSSTDAGLSNGRREIRTRDLRFRSGMNRRPTGRPTSRRHPHLTQVEPRHARHGHRDAGNMSGEHHAQPLP